MADADLTAELAKAKRIADGLQFACRLPDKKPDFTFAGGPAAEAYWEYFHPSRVATLLAAIEAVLELAGNTNPILSGFSDMSVIGFTLDPKAIREAISRELTKGESDGT